MRELLLLRHGKSDWPPETPDFDRPLTKRGQRNAARIGAYLHEQNLIPDRIVTSPAQRTTDTARCVAEALGIKPASIIEEPRLYLAEVQTIFALIHDLPKAVKRVLLVGHNPGMENMVAEISGIPEPFPTGTLAVLRHEDSWESFIPGKVEIITLIRPRELD